MFKRSSAALLACLFVTVASGCGLDELSRDRLLVWHDWPDAEASILTELIAGYEDLDPDLELIVEHVPSEQIEARFADEVRSGFGPDVLIGADAELLTDLVDEGAVHRISPEQTERFGFDELDERALAAMSVDDAQRGIPLAAFTDVMYYRHGVSPPESLDQVIDLAKDGHSIAIPLDFFDAYWGIDAFDGNIFGGPDEVAPDAGFTKWVRWLVEARRQPNVILDAEYDVLRDLFADGKLDVFIGGSRELGTFRSMLHQSDQDAGASSDRSDDDAGDDADDPLDSSTPTLTNVVDLTFGLTTLPGANGAAAGGFLDVEGMIVNQHTDSLSGALELMAYLTNVPSQGRIARAGVGRIPVNPSVSIDPTISPMEAALVVQQRHAVVMPERFQDHQSELRLVATDVYLEATRGLIQPSQAAGALQQRFRDALAAGSEGLDT